MIKKILLAFLTVMLLHAGAFSIDKMGIGVSSVSLTNLSATGVHFVLNPTSNISLRFRVYGNDYYQTGSPHTYFSGAQISCLYNFHPIINGKVIPQLGCSFDGWQYWSGYESNITMYAFNILLGAEWFIYDYLSIYLSWPFLSTQSYYMSGKLDSTRTSYFNGNVTAGMTLYFL